MKSNFFQIVLIAAFFLFAGSSALFGQSVVDGSNPHSKSQFQKKAAGLTNSITQNLAGVWRAEKNVEDGRGAADAVPNSNPTFVSGIVGSAFSFNGSEFLSIPADPLFGFNNDRLNPRDFTVECWIRPATVSGRQYIFSKDFSASGFIRPAYSLYLENSQLVSFIYGANGQTNAISTGAIVTANNWQHVALTYDSAAGIIKIFVNGSEAATSLPQPGVSFVTETLDLTIARGYSPNTGPYYFYNGLIDEFSIYHRTLSSFEIEEIFLSGAAGKRISGTELPSGVLGWWTLENSLQDFTGNGSDGTIGNQSFTNGWVADALKTGNSPLASIPDSPTLSPPNITIETWIKRISINLSGRHYLIRKPQTSSSNNALALFIENDILYGQISDGANIYTTPAFTLPANYLNFRWRHLALTFDDAANILTVFIDGIRVGQTNVPVSINYDGTSPWQIGDTNADTLFDELAIYDRAFPTLSDNRNEELLAIVYAGKNGKIRTRQTPAGSFVQNSFGLLDITFSNVSSQGETTATPLSTGSLGLPSNFAVGTAAFEINTTAVFTGNIEICFTLPNWNPNDAAGFAQLKMMHFENGAWIDRTTFIDFPSRRVCGVVNSLSPFAVAQQLAPTAANVSVGGRVLTSDGRGVSNAFVNLTDANGNMRTARTNPFGFYSFTEVPVGASYIVSVTHKSHQFSPRILSVFSEISDFDLTADN